MAHWSLFVMFTDECQCSTCKEANVNREGRYCGLCGVLNPQTSHWHIGSKRFCKKEHYDEYKKREEQRDSQRFESEHLPAKEMNGYGLPHFPADRDSHVVHHLIHGRSPRER